MTTETTARDPNHTPPRDCPPIFDATHDILVNPDNYSLSTLLDGLYHHFDIANYLDQLKPIDDRLDNIVNLLNDLKANFRNLENDDIDDFLTDIIDSINDSDDAGHGR